MTSATFAGSSPLARGLRRGIEPRYGLRRIIPARAGFTPHRPYERSHRADHPRSRGVYRTPLGLPAPSVGSSPLARGLLSIDPGTGHVLRIIPARAGFTGRAGPRACGAADHPRSRGVYNEEGDKPAVGQGSSPLARGLLPLTHTPHASIWIIPARAGFTGPLSPRSTRFRDHPRSRGVYSQSQK